MIKAITLGEAKAFINWFEYYRNTKIKLLPMKVQWKLLSNYKQVEPFVLRFDEFRNDTINSLHNEYFGEEKSEEISIIARDESGKEILDDNGEPIMEDTRKVKDEFLEEYKNKVDEINNTITGLLLEENEYDISELNIDNIIDQLPNDTEFELSDIEIMSLFE